MESDGCALSSFDGARPAIFLETRHGPTDGPKWADSHCAPLIRCEPDCWITWVMSSRRQQWTRQWRLLPRMLVTIRLRNVLLLPRFPCAEESAHEVPPNSFHATRPRMPCIYAPGEIAQLMGAAAQLRESYPQRPGTLIGLIAAPVFAFLRCSTSGFMVGCPIASCRSVGPSSARAVWFAVGRKSADCALHGGARLSPDSSPGGYHVGTLLPRTSEHSGRGSRPESSAGRCALLTLMNGGPRSCLLGLS